MTVLHATDATGRVVVEAARYVGSAGIARGVIEAAGVAVAAVAIYGGVLRRRLAGVMLLAYLGWYGWKAIIFTQHATTASWPWSSVAVIGLGAVAVCWLAFGPRPQRSRRAADFETGGAEPTSTA